MNIERPDRHHAQFTAESIANLRFDNSLSDAMNTLYEQHGDEVYQTGFYTKHKDALKKWSESEELGLSSAQRKKILDIETWENQLTIMIHAKTLREALGDDLYTDFNLFTKKVENVLKTHEIKLKLNERKQIFDAVSWYDETGEKVIKSITTLKADKIQALCERFGCEPEQLADFGYYSA